ncbi:MAG: hypothetical protein ACC618_03810 [Patescibacteria group bacterium]
MKKETSQTILPDQEEVVFTQKVDEWVAGEASYEEVIEHIPSHYLSPEKRIARTAKRQVAQLVNRVKEDLRKVEL